MRRLFLVLAGLGIAVVLSAGFATAASGLTRARAPKTAKIVIRHEVRGCHTWSVNGKAFRAAQSLSLARGGVIAVVNNDVMPQRLFKKSGPAVRYVGSPAMSHMSASVKVVFPKAGVYRLVTKAGEDYPSFKNAKTIGEDNVLTLKVTVS
jgi:hypothetical protein